MNDKNKDDFANAGQNTWATTFGIGRYSTGMSRSLSSAKRGAKGKSNRRSSMGSMGGFLGTSREEGIPATDCSKDTIQNRINNSIVADPSSYVLQTTTVPQQARKESNFIGSAYHYYLALPQVQRAMAGDYVVVSARPKTSRSFPRGEGVETFDPNFQNRIEIKTEPPKGNSAEAARIGRIIANEGFFGVGVLYFNGRKIDLYFEPPYTSNKLVSPVRTETLKNEQGSIQPATLLDQVIDFGVRDVGSTARFGIKDMCHVFNVMHGFYFIALDLAVWNLKTEEEDIHHVIGVKLPDEGEVASAFILKQIVEFPHYSWYRWQKFTTQEELKRKALLPAVDKAVSDFYEEEEPGFREKNVRKNKGIFYGNMDWMDLL